MHRDSVWAIVGKVGVLVGVTLGLINIYGFFRPAEAHVTCRCQVVDLNVPYYGNLAPTLNELEQGADSERILKLLTDAKLQPPTTGGDLQAPSQQIGAAIRLPLFKLKNAVEDVQRAVALCEVKNVGKREAKDVRLAFPFDIAGARIDDNLALTDQIRKRTVLLGSIRPGMSVSLSAVSDKYGFRSWREDDYIISHEDGSEKVLLSKPVYGSLATIVEVGRVVGPAPLLVIIAGVSALWIMPIARRRMQAQRASGAVSVPVGSQPETEKLPTDTKPGGAA